MDAKGHTESIIKGTAATCTESGLTDGKKCPACGEMLLEQQTIAPTGHSWGEGITTKDPTETETGIRTYTCKNCGETKTEAIPVLSHTHRYTMTVTASTCTEKGYTTHKCSCGDSYIDNYVDAKGHSMGEWKQTKAPTCTEKGEEKSVCKNCSHFETREIAPLGHTYKDTVTKPTCTDKGYTTHKCDCGNSYVDSYIDAKGHAWDNGKVTKEPTESETGIKTFTCKNCNETKTESIPTIAHTHKYTATVTAPTCTEKGYTTYKCACGSTYTDNPVAEKGHTESVTKGKASTCLKTGLTDKIFCSVCQTVLKESTVIPKKEHSFDAKGCSVCGIKFADNDGYLCLATFQNGKALQAFYNELDRIAAEFHASGKDIAASGEIAMVGHIAQSNFGLTLDEAILAFSFYKNDHPNYFWIYPGYATTTMGEFALITSAEYCLAINRATHEQLIHSALNEYLELVKDEDSAYEMALAFHDKIITSTVYSATEEDMNAVWAHNVIGVLEKGNGVCESYAKTFQLLLNCVGVENIYVSGISYGINHVWNLIQLDDGQWYWCDLTWDDDEDNSLGLGWGISYNYFCVNDTQSVLHYYQDGGYLVDDNDDGKHDVANIHESHILEFSHHLPKRSDKIFDGSLRDTFTVDGLQFAISGYRTVQFVYTEKTGTVNIPATVEYEGVIYKVTSVGGIKEDGIYSRNPVAPYASKLNLPKSVIYVWEGAIKN